MFVPAKTLSAVFGVAPASLPPAAALMWQLVGVGLCTAVAGACYSLKVGVIN